LLTVKGILASEMGPETDNTSPSISVLPRLIMRVENFQLIPDCEMLAAMALKSKLQFRTADLTQVGTAGVEFQNDSVDAELLKHDTKVPLLNEIPNLYPAFSASTYSDDDDLYAVVLRNKQGVTSASPMDNMTVNDSAPKAIGCTLAQR
jgi:hypothetical protein